LGGCLCAATFFLLGLHAAEAEAPEGFPVFEVPGFEREMGLMRDLFRLHYEPAGPLIPLWEEWMSMSTLWPAVESEGELDRMRHRWAKALAGRGMNTDGYVHTHQHDGPAHSEGWPFPLWEQAGGIGWHFAPLGVPGYEAPLTTPEEWTFQGAVPGELLTRGWHVRLEEPLASIAPPPFAIDSGVAPWLRLNWWAEGLAGTDCWVEWTTDQAPEFGTERRMAFSGVGGLEVEGDEGTPNIGGRDQRTMIPVFRHPAWRGTVTGLRLRFGNTGAAQVVIKALHTASDTRHNINNPNWVRGCCHYFLWTRDLAFLRDQIGRMRKAMHFMMDEFQTRARHCVYTTWPGHEGRSGIRYIDGRKELVRGSGVGSNYWDLLPFGGEDALATIYFYDALGMMADLEEAIAGHPEWAIPLGHDAFDPAELREHAQELKAYGNKRFWNPETDRFGTVDLDGNLHDYGFTFLNNEAVYYGFADDAHARAIYDWMSGRRLVEGDTSTGADIYHWRFGPRSTTRRNIEYYFWGWSSPESIGWGDQVQDGGAVLGFSFHDLMARLKQAGPDDAWVRLVEILDWFEKVQAEGGYRAYYADPARGRGSLQGGNVPGGLGMDREFFESILVPQVMLYGFLGMRPTPQGAELHPRLPEAWEELRINRIYLHRHILDIRVRGTAIEITDQALPGAEPLGLRTALPFTIDLHTP